MNRYTIDISSDDGVPRASTYQRSKRVVDLVNIKTRSRSPRAQRNGVDNGPLPPSPESESDSEDLTTLTAIYKLNQQSLSSFNTARHHRSSPDPFTTNGHRAVRTVKAVTHKRGHPDDDQPASLSQKKLKYNKTDHTLAKASESPFTTSNTHHSPDDADRRIGWTEREKILLFGLRDAGRSWDEIMLHFPARKLATVQWYYSYSGSAKKRNSRPREPALPENDDLIHDPSFTGESKEHLVRRTTSDVPNIDDGQGGRRRLMRRARSDRETADPDAYREPQVPVPTDVQPKHEEESTSLSLSRLLRDREVGGSVDSSGAARSVMLENKVTTSYTMEKYVDGASGDVCTVAWAPDGKWFAAGAVAFTDPNSMQYNRPKNLLLGHTGGHLVELPDHHIKRPRVDFGVNSLASMRRTQEPRLFTTVQMVAFSPVAPKMCSVSIDGRLNVYDYQGDDPEQARHCGSTKWGVSVDCLSIGNDGLVATGRKIDKGDSISILDISDDTPVELKSFSSKSSEAQLSIFPAAVKWGIASHHSRYLLTGFAQDKAALYEVDGVDVLGKTCLFDVETGSIPVQTIPRCVFDVAWNPNIGGHTVFAVASVSTQSCTRSVVRLFSTMYGSLRHQVELECPAPDLNDVLYCPYDDNLVAAGSTDGCVYIWDTRWSNLSQNPQRRYTHGSCLSVLSHEKQRWQADTGIRFLSWGANSSRLYSGSSDGIVKCWNPYLHEENSHVEDIATFQSNIMSGAFSPDFTSLLIGEDRGRISLLSRTIDPSQDLSDTTEPVTTFKMIHAPCPAEDDRKIDKELVESGAIVFANMGPFPVRQAVQGPNYNASALANAVSQDANGQVDILEAEYAALQSQSEKTDLQLQARRFQKALREQRNEWKIMARSVAMEDPVKKCKLKCAYTQRVMGNEDDCDSGRSWDRIPDQLRCPGPSTFLECARLGLIGKCAECGRPARPVQGGGDATSLCESCNLGCVRCGAPTELLDHYTRIRCHSCHVDWRMDCLGYYSVSGGEIRHDGQMANGGLVQTSPKSKRTALDECSYLDESASLYMEMTDQELDALYGPYDRK